ncbi:hypothetical protein AA13594_2776 [Gluconacetobacter azotocaptans DSM 13594]|nr:hypothetical protein AA13594_2776 [Gluconacetobacter azotocaptans DSM 13594]
MIGHAGSDRDTHALADRRDGPDTINARHMPRSPTGRCLRNDLPIDRIERDYGVSYDDLAWPRRRNDLLLQ